MSLPGGFAFNGTQGLAFQSDTKLKLYLKWIPFKSISFTKTSDMPVTKSPSLNKTGCVNFAFTINSSFEVHIAKCVDERNRTTLGHVVSRLKSQSCYPALLPKLFSWQETRSICTYLGKTLPVMFTRKDQDLLLMSLHFTSPVPTKTKLFPIEALYIGLAVKNEVRATLAFAGVYLPLVSRATEELALWCVAFCQYNFI